VRGVLTSDLLMKNIYVYVAEEGYAARVQDTRSYDAIRSKKFVLFCDSYVNRYVFPVKTSCQDGHFHLCQTTITQGVTSTNTGEEIGTSQKTIRSSWQGMKLTNKIINVSWSRTSIIWKERLMLVQTRSSAHTAPSLRTLPSLLLCSDRIALSAPARLSKTLTYSQAQVLAGIVRLKRVLLV